MAEPFQILARFLEKFGDDVEGRQVAEPAEATRAQLSQLARGALREKERTELMGQLSRNPEWLAWLAQEIKRLRNAAP